MQRVQDIVRAFDNPSNRLDAVKSLWHFRLNALTVKTPDAGLNRMLNTWLPYQTTASRLWARAGFYQAGGAIGFRDQLQDMLVLLYTRPDEVRAHILEAASHQFVEGDVMHWWHPPAMGVRTRLSDDKLFLPYMTAMYIESTEDASILRAARPFLAGKPLPEGAEDQYGEAPPTSQTATLMEHCLRALDSVKLGVHGIPLIGHGDWNDALNRVGENGKGESVWLGFFYVECLRKFGVLCDEQTRGRLHDNADGILKAIERHAWDGSWYRRAWFDDGMAIGSRESPECEIDAIAQSWAVIAGADRARAEQAVDSAIERLYDDETGVLRLLDPPFNGACSPGYIRGYLPGVRENGGQYTHGASWIALALATLGRREQAWRIYRRLLPDTHSRFMEEAANYRVEPYVVAADVYSNPQQMGRGGWTWYTGAAAWLYNIGIRHLLGFEKRGLKIRLNASAQDAFGGGAPAAWDRYEMVFRWGASAYHLQARRDVRGAMLDGVRIPEIKNGWVDLRDDGRDHLAVYPMLD
ncbi:MAG: hypothetical protein LBS72_03730 [Oscillospiraceae bacterium]|jgi:cellobiose phosphorylase|nr:hypothetical protein [Oscillospiraceae bacterium]